MIDHYRQAWRLYWSALPVLLGFALLIAAIDVFFASSSASMGGVVGQLIILYYFHRSCLFGEPLLAFGKPDPKAPPLKFGGFIMISLALIIVPAAISLTVTLSLLEEWDKESAVVMMLLFLGPLYLVSLSMFGTALPASVARPVNFQMSKGIRATFATMWRLILGPGVTTVATFGLLIAVGYLLGDTPAFQSNIGQLFFLTIATLAGFFLSLLGVVVLCHMYHRIMGIGAPQPTDPDTFS